MKIGVNLTPLRLGRAGGIKQLVFSLLTSLLEQNSDESYIYYINRSLRNIFASYNDRIRVVELPLATKEIGLRGTYGEYDVLYAPITDIGMQTASVPTVNLIVDLQHNAFPDFFSRNEIISRRLSWEWCARASQSVCVISNFVADSVVSDLGIERSRIVLTPPSLPEYFYSTPDPRTEKDFQDKLGKNLPEKFIFYPANTWTHKNHITLLKALDKLRKSGDVVPLVLAGWPSSGHDDIIKLIKSLHLENLTTNIGYVADEWIPFLYKRAHALVFPSLYEGFGIPLLEAMYSGCPIACSNTTSCPEVAGEAAIYFDPTSEDDLASAISEVVNHAQTRSRLIEAGREQAKCFSGEKSASTLLEALYNSTTSYENPTRWTWSADEAKTSLQTHQGDHNLPLVSVIVPSYQQGCFIRSTIDSILEQDYPHIEIIVIDGGSTDETVEILKSFKNKIQWISESDHGQANALNKGLKLAKGSIIGWLNSDDTYLPQAVQKGVYALSKRSGCWLVYGEGLYIDENGVKTGRYPTETYSAKNILRHCIICQPTVFFNRKLYEIGGGADEQYDMALDYEMWLRYSRITHFLYIPDELACSRMYQQNKTSLFRTQSIKEGRRASKAHYGRSSALWCLQFATAHAEQIPLLGRISWLRAPLQLLFFLYAYMRDMVPYHIFILARSFYRTIKL